MRFEKEDWDVGRAGDREGRVGEVMG